MRAFPSKAFVLDLSEEDLAEIIHQSTSKRISDKRVEYLVDKLIGSTKQSYCATKKTSPIIEEVRYYAGELQRLTERRQTILDKMVELAKPLPEYEILLSIPGIAETTATSIIGELGDIRRFQFANQINAFIGIDLRHYESGNFLAQEHITKRTFMRNEKDNRRRLQLSLIRLPQCIASYRQCITSLRITNFTITL